MGKGGGQATSPPHLFVRVQFWPYLQSPRKRIETAANKYRFLFVLSIWFSLFSLFTTSNYCSFQYNCLLLTYFSIIQNKNRHYNGDNSRNSSSSSSSNHRSKGSWIYYYDASSSMYEHQGRIYNTSTTHDDRLFFVFHCWHVNDSIHVLFLDTNCYPVPLQYCTTFDILSFVPYFFGMFLCGSWIRLLRVLSSTSTKILIVDVEVVVMDGNRDYYRLG